MASNEKFKVEASSYVVQSLKVEDFLKAEFRDEIRKQLPNVVVVSIGFTSFEGSKQELLYLGHHLHEEKKESERLSVDGTDPELTKKMLEIVMKVMG